MDYFSIEIIIVKFWGYFFLAFSIPLLLSKASRSAFIEISKNKSFIYSSGFLSLIVCIPLVLINNVWRADIVGFTTLMAWAGILKGMLRIYNPQISIEKTNTFNDNQFKLVVIFTFLIGIAFVYAGFNPYWC